MTRAETITFAIDAGFNPMNSEEMDMFVAFAKLVAEREREACAKIADELHQGYAHDIAMEIRARGN